MDIEKMLIAKIVADGNLDEVSDSGITVEFFFSPKCRQMFTDLWRYKTQYGEVPNLEMLRRDHPMVSLPDPEGYPLAYLIDEVCQSRKHSLVSDGIVEAAAYLQADDPEKALDIMQRTIRQVVLAVPSTTTGDLTLETLEDQTKAYEDLRKRDGRLLGIPSGFPSIDQALQGFQPGQLITIVGLAKSGKSTLMLLAAMAAHIHAFVVWFLGFEMGFYEQKQRHDAIRAKVSHQKLRTAALSNPEYNGLKKMWRGMQSMPSFTICTDNNSAITLSGLQVQIERAAPAIAFIDGIYMMRDEEGEPQGSPQALTNITRGLKRLATNLNIPIVISTQALSWKTDKKRGVVASSIGYSSSFIQDSDAVISVEETELPNTNKVKILGARNAATMEVYIRWDWESGTFEELPNDPFEQESVDMLPGSDDAESGFHHA